MKTTLVLQPLSETDVPPPTPTPTNEALVASIQQGDGDALWTLFNRHADLLRGVVTRCLSDEDECEEVLREVFENIRDRAVYYTVDMGRALGWIMTLARQRALDRARRVAARPQPQLVARETAAHSERSSGSVRRRRRSAAEIQFQPGTDFIPAAA